MFSWGKDKITFEAKVTPFCKILRIFVVPRDQVILSWWCAKLALLLCTSITYEHNTMLIMRLREHERNERIICKRARDEYKQGDTKVKRSDEPHDLWTTIWARKEKMIWCIKVSLCVPHWSKKHSLFYLSSFADCEFLFINHLCIFCDVYLFNHDDNGQELLSFTPRVHEYFQFSRSPTKKKLISASCWVDKWSIFSTPEKIYLSQQHLRFLLHWKKNSWLENPWK